MIGLHPFAYVTLGKLMCMEMSNVEANSPPPPPQFSTNTVQVQIGPRQAQIYLFPYRRLGA